MYKKRFLERNKPRSALELRLYRQGLGLDMLTRLAAEILGRADSFADDYIPDDTVREVLEHVIDTPVMRLFRDYFQPEFIGDIPEGGSLLVGNHSGMFGWDAMAVQISVFEKFGEPVRGFGLSTFGGSDMMRTLGVMPRDKDLCVRVLEDGSTCFCCPGGAEEVAKPYTEMYKVQKVGSFHHGHGYLKVAIRAGKPVVPVGIVGAEETHINYGDMKDDLSAVVEKVYSNLPSAIKGVLGNLVDTMRCVPKVPKLKNIIPKRSKIYIFAGEPLDPKEEWPFPAEHLRDIGRYPWIAERLSDFNDKVASRIQNTLYEGLRYRLVEELAR